jgi:hypothetical protein
MNFEPDVKNQDVEEIIGLTQSVCPICLKLIPAERVKENDWVFLRKTCGKHGNFKTVIWRGKPDYLSWQRQKKPEYPKVCLTKTKKGCPFDCGLCPSHRQQICCVLIEVTERCNLRCPVCFADAGAEVSNQGRAEDLIKDPTLEELLDRLKMIWNTTGRCNIQLSGGEPTVRDDLPDIIRAARSLGYTFFQLNTNGIRLGEDPDYVQALKEAGLSTVFLQFDGTRDKIYRCLRGRSLFKAKQKAIESCGHQQLGVVLVPTLVPGINTDHIGDIVRYAMKGMPIIKGVHFQPVSYFGRYPAPPEDKDRITLPEVLRALEEQTDGLLKVADFAPSDCESSLCSFHGDFIYMEDGKLTPSTKKQNACCSSQENDRVESVSRAQNFVTKRWQIQKNTTCCGSEKSPKGQDSWGVVLDRIRNYRLSITCMVYQDAETMDLERLQYCCVPVVDGTKAIPFCAYNLSSRDGHSLYREKRRYL